MSQAYSSIIRQCQRLCANVCEERRSGQGIDSVIAALIPVKGIAPLTYSCTLRLTCLFSKMPPNDIAVILTNVSSPSAGLPYS